MPRLIFENRVSSSVEKVWEFHSSVEALTVLTEPGREVQLVGNDLAVVEGALHKVRFKKFGIWLRWEARISEVHPPDQFRDTQEKGIFPEWTHLHEFISIEGGTLIRDTIDYRAPGGALIDRYFVAPDIHRMWAYRMSITQERLGKIN